MNNPERDELPGPEPARRYQPVDLLTMGYAALVFLAVAALGGHLENQVEYLAFHLGVFLGVRLVVPLARRSSIGLFRFLADVYPLAIYTFFYIFANRVNTIFFREIPNAPQPGPAGHFDPFFRELDRQIFGVEPSFWLAETLGSPLVHEIVHALYSTYYLLIPVITLVIYFRGRDRIEFQRCLFTVSLTFYASYLAFIVLPVHGPNLLRGNDYAGGVLFVPIMDAIYATAEPGGGAFPSSHVAVSLVGVIFAARHSRTLFRIWIIPLLGLTFATVYCRYHYAVDSAAGILWGLLFFAVGTFIFNLTLKIRSQC